MRPTKILMVFGTRPEAIKMAPLIREFRKFPDQLIVKICNTGQHKEMLDQVTDFFGITPDHDLGLMKNDQGLEALTASVLGGVTGVIRQDRPDYVFVQGDTTTSFASALAAFYEGVKVGHVEAGLRTLDKKAPFPEEINRQLTSRIADLHFAPTETAKQNLVAEGIDEASIFVTGNTVIDALFEGLDLIKEKKPEGVTRLEKILDADKKQILITGHRRENFGEGFHQICKALTEIAEDSEVQVIYPVHLNPNVREPVFKLLGDIPNVHLIEPVAYPEFIWLMERSYLILTDSGGVQEEAPSLGKPVLVMREVTERPEAVEAGTVLLVGTDPDKIVSETRRLLSDPEKYMAMSKRHNPYGDGQASRRIREVKLSHS